MSDNQHRDNMVDKGWDQMSTLLDREMPSDKVGVWPYWWMAGIGILLLGLLGGYFWLQNGDSSKVTEETAIYTENANSIEKKSRDLENEIESLIFESDGTSDNGESTNTSSDFEQPVQKQTHSNNKRLPKQSTPIDKAETQLHAQSTDGGIEYLEKAGFHHVEVDEEKVRNKKQSALLPLASISLSLLPMDDILPEGNPQLKTTVVDDYSITISPVVYMGAGSNFMDHASLSVRTGINYSFSPQWSTSTLLGYQMSHLMADNIFISRNNSGLTDGMVISFPSNESSQYSTQLTFGDITQHLLTASQYMNYNIFPNWSLYLGAGIAHEVLIQSKGNIQENYPVFVGVDQLEFRNRTLDANDFKSYSADWYGMLELGAEYRIHSNWSLNAGISTLQSLHADKDHLGLNHSRRIQFDLGIKWEL